MPSLSLGATNKSLTVLLTLKCTWTLAFPHILLKLLLSPFLIWDHYEDVLASICVPVGIRVVVVVLSAEFVVNFGLESMEDQVRVLCIC